jgi:uncharacterized protein (DUF1499 family)
MKLRRLTSLSALLCLACAAPVPPDLGIGSGRLAPCPESPNCVSTAETGEHYTAPFRLAKPAGEAWQEAREAVLSLPRTRIVRASEDYLHAESTTPLLRFVDDLELHLLADRQQIAVRSASRSGWSDLGANRERVWELRQAMQAQGTLR